jgi:hypothetical protein
MRFSGQKLWNWSPTLARGPNGGLQHLSAPIAAYRQSRIACSSLVTVTGSSRFVIRDDQLEQLSAPARARFVNELRPWVAEQWPDRVNALGEAGLLPWLADVVAASIRHGMSAERDVSAFVALRCMFGDGFEQLAWAAPVLNDATLAGSTKADMLYQRGAAMRALAPPPAAE